MHVYPVIYSLIVVMINLNVMGGSTCLSCEEKQTDVKTYLLLEVGAE